MKIDQEVLWYIGYIGLEHYFFSGSWGLVNCPIYHGTSWSIFTVSDIWGNKVNWYVNEENMTSLIKLLTTDKVNFQAMFNVKSADMHGQSALEHEEPRSDNGQCHVFPHWHASLWHFCKLVTVVSQSEIDWGMTERTSSWISHKAEKIFVCQPKEGKPIPLKHCTYGHGQCQMKNMLGF